MLNRADYPLCKKAQQQEIFKPETVLKMMVTLRAGENEIIVILEIITLRVDSISVGKMKIYASLPEGVLRFLGFGFRI